LSLFLRIKVFVDSNIKTDAIYISHLFLKFDRYDRRFYMPNR